MADDHTLTWKLSDPGMDILERAGLAGLYMALQAAEDKERDLAPLSWELTPDSVTVHWTGPARPGFEKLMDWAWQVTKKDCVLYLPGVHDENERANFHLRVSTHTGIMRTFLQHTNVQPKGEPVQKTVRLDDSREVSLSYQPPIVRPPKVKDGAVPPAAAKKLLKPSRDVADLFDRNAAFRSGTVELSNWVYPGIAGRYGGEGAWEGSPERAVILMLAPTVCLFQRLQGEGGNWVFVVPDVRDLEDFAAIRKQMTLNADFVDVASMGDAGLQFFAEYASRKPRHSLAGCRVVAMGKVGYYASQSIRKAVLDVTADEHQVDRYRALHQQFRNVYVDLRTDEKEAKPTAKRTRSAKTKKKSANDSPKAAGFIKLPAARGRIADNLVNRRPWYENLAIPMIWDHDELERQRKRNKELNDRVGGKRPTSHESILFLALHYQRSKLMALINQDDMWDDPQDRAILDAFWDTLARHYFLERKAAEQRGGSRTAEERMNQLNEDLRRSLLQAKTQLLLRQTLTEFFSRPAGLPRSAALCNNIAVVWRLLNRDWRKGRDLALLALMTYQSREKRDELRTPTTTVTEGA